MPRLGIGYPRNRLRLLCDAVASQCEQCGAHLRLNCDAEALLCTEWSQRVYFDATAPQQPKENQPLSRVIRSLEVVYSG